MTSFDEGFALAQWLESTARPVLRKWVKSGDDRVQLQAVLLTEIIEGHAEAGDWGTLAAIRQSWLSWTEAHRPAVGTLTPVAAQPTLDGKAAANA